jgi:hypothetical protein
MATATAAVTAVMSTDSVQFNKGMKAAADATRSAAGQINAALAGLSKPFQVVNGFAGELASTISGPLAGSFASITRGGAYVGAGVAGISVAFLAAGRSALKAADDIGDMANSLGITTDQLQELRYSAMLGGVGVEGLDSALNKLNQNRGQAQDGIGSLVDFLKDYDRQLLLNIQNSKDAGEAFTLVADAIEKETDAAKRRQLATAAFGKGEINMINLLSQGADAFKRQADEAHKLGLVVDEDLIRKSGEANDKLDILSQTIKIKAVSAMVELAPQIDAVATVLIKATEKAFEFLGAIMSIRTGALQEQLKAVTGEIENLNNKLASVDSGRSSGMGSMEQWAVKRREALRAERDEIIRNISAQQKAEDAAKRTAEARTTAARKTPYIKSETDASNKKAADETKRAADEAERLQRIYDQADNAAAAFRVENDAATKSMERMRKAAQDAGDAVSNAFDQVVRQGASVGDTLRSLAIDLVNLAYKAAIGDQVSSGISRLVGAAVGSIFGGASSAPGTFFGPGDAAVARGSASITWAGARANGGPVTAGQSYMVGERGPERFTPNSNGWITPNEGRGGGTTIGTLNIDARGAQAGVSDEIVAAIRNLDASIGPRAVRAVVAERQRNPNLFA